MSSTDWNKSTGNRPEIQPENWPCPGHTIRMDILYQRRIIIQPHYTQSLIRKLSLKSCDFVTSCLNSTKEMKPEPLRSVSSRTFLTTSICTAEQSENNYHKVYQTPSLSPACPRSPGPRPAPSGQSGRTQSCKCRLWEKYKVRTNDSEQVHTFC